MKRSDSSKKIKEVRRLYSSKGIKSLPYQKGLDSDSCSFGRLQSVHRSNRSKSCNLEAGTNGLLGRWAKISFGAATCRKINTVGEEISFGRLSTYVGEEISISCLRGKELPLFHAALAKGPCGDQKCRASLSGLHQGVQASALGIGLVSLLLRHVRWIIDKGWPSMCRNYPNVLGCDMMDSAMV